MSLLKHHEGVCSYVHVYSLFMYYLKKKYFYVIIVKNAFKRNGHLTRQGFTNIVINIH